ncbi:MAG: hypothetical protein LBU58_12585, partial [Clostridiales bacterium]|nr:hypothetical protein [Clostridiales bacterium]
SKNTFTLKADTAKSKKAYGEGQDITVLDEYIYSIYSPSTSSGYPNNSILVTNKNTGKEVKSCILDGTGHLEGESLFIYGNKMYIMFKDVTVKTSKLKDKVFGGKERKIKLCSIPLSYLN